MPSATIKLFLVHGDAKRLRTAELSNWNGKAVAGPRSELDSLLARDDSLKSGVYFLTGTDSKTGEAVVYVGEAEVIRSRLRGHLDKEFWNHVVFFVSKDDNLTKGHIRYLEGRLIATAKEAGRANVSNGQSSGSPLPESDREDMEIFLEKILQLMPVLGADALLPVRMAPQGETENELLICSIFGLEAKGRVTPSGFVMHKGSQAVLRERQSTKNFPQAIARRLSLIEDGILIEQGDHLLLTRDTEFTSPSAAAAVVHGGSANGLIAWKNSSGKTLKELEAN